MTANVDCVDRLDIALDYGMHSYEYVLRPAAPNNRLLIYHQGHDDFLLSGGGRETLRDFLDRGFTAATFWMPLHGETTKTAYDVPGHGTVTFYWHNPMTVLEDARGSFIRFFLEPVACMTCRAWWCRAGSHCRPRMAKTRARCRRLERASHTVWSHFRRQRN